MASNIHTFNARDFRSNPIYRHQANFAGIQEELQKITDFYHRLERQYNYFTVALIICIAVPLMLLFTLPILRELGWLLIFGFLLAGIYAGTMRQRARQWQFPRDRDRLFSDVLKLVKRDMDPLDPLDIQLCLGKATQTGKAIQKRPAPHTPSLQLEDWRNPWFGIKGRFLDGSLFSLRLVERVTFSITDPSQTAAEQKPDRPKNRSTDKGKTSTCEGFDLNLQLHVDEQNYGNLTPLAPHLSGAVKLLPGAELIHHHSAEQDLSFTLHLPPAFTASLMYQSTAMLFLSAYHILHLAAELHRPNSAIPATAFSPSPSDGFKSNIAPGAPANLYSQQSRGGLSQ